MMLEQIIRRQEEFARRLGKASDAFERIVGAECESVRSKGSPRQSGNKTVTLYIPEEVRARFEKEREFLGLVTQRDVYYLALMIGYRAMLGARPEMEEPQPAQAKMPPRIVWPPEARKDNIKAAVEYSKRPRTEEDP